MKPLAQARSWLLALLAATLVVSIVVDATPAAAQYGGSSYGPSRSYRDQNVGNWAIGTFHGQNGANGAEETITIRPDGSAELRTRGEAPRYGTFAGETLTIESRISKVQPARGGIVVDGSYYRR